MKDDGEPIAPLKPLSEKAKQLKALMDNDPEFREKIRAASQQLVNESWEKEEAENRAKAQAETKR